MSNFPPDDEAPVTLRAARELGARPAQRPAPEAAVAAPLSPPATRAPAPLQQPGRDGDDRLATTTLAMAGVAFVSSVGWVIQRRQRLARHGAVQQDGPPAEMAMDLALPVEGQGQRSRPAFGTRGTKRLIKLLMGLRTVAGASAILAAIAVVVFWSIEITDSGARDTGLTLGLLGFLLFAWVGFWGSGRLANMLHRSAFNRDHPKFAD